MPGIPNKGGRTSHLAALRTRRRSCTQADSPIRRPPLTKGYHCYVLQVGLLAAAALSDRNWQIALQRIKCYEKSEYYTICISIRSFLLDYARSSLQRGGTLGKDFALQAMKTGAPGLRHEGANSYIRKPVDFEQFSDVVRHWASIGSSLTNHRPGSRERTIE